MTTRSKPEDTAPSYLSDSGWRTLALNALAFFLVVMNGAHVMYGGFTRPCTRRRRSISVCHERDFMANPPDCRCVNRDPLEDAFYAQAATSIVRDPLPRKRRMPRRCPSLALSIRLLLKARLAMNSAIVKPIPASRPPPASSLQRRFHFKPITGSSDEEDDSRGGEGARGAEMQLNRN